MKMSEIKVEKVKDFETMQELFLDHFGAHWQYILEDFKAANLGGIQSIGDPEVKKKDRPQIEQAILFYLMYYSYGVMNTLDPKSSFNINYGHAVKINKELRAAKILESTIDNEHE